MMKGSGRWHWGKAGEPGQKQNVIVTAVTSDVDRDIWII